MDQRWSVIDDGVQGALATPALIERKTYSFTPTSLTVRAGVVTGEITDMQVAEQIEKRSGRVLSPPKLTATLKLTNTSATRSIRLVSAKIQYLDDQWRPITLEDSRADAIFKFAPYSSERLDPGQEAIQPVVLAFPAEALKAKTLKGLRLKIAYIPLPYREETTSFAVSIDGQ